MQPIIVDSVPQLWPPKDVASLRAKTNGWRVKVTIGRRAVYCKACGDQIPAGTKRIDAKHLLLAGRNSFYDMRGFVCVDVKTCEEHRTFNSCIESACAEAEAALAADPSLIEEPAPNTAEYLSALLDRSSTSTSRSSEHR